MPGIAKPWFKRPLPLIGAIFGSVVLLFVVLFFWKVGTYVMILKGGGRVEGMDALSDLVKRRFDLASMTPSDREALEDATGNPTLGNPNAAVRIVEFVDYQCTYCKQAAPVLREFMESHKTDAYLILRDFPISELHADAETAALAAHCVFDASPDRFWTYYDGLFARQDGLSPDALRLYAREIGTGMSAYDACVAAKKPFAPIQSGRMTGTRFGVSGTPTFFVNGVEFAGTQSMEMLDRMFAEASKRATR